MAQIDGFYDSIRQEINKLEETSHGNIQKICKSD